MIHLVSYSSSLTQPHVEEFHLLKELSLKKILYSSIRVLFCWWMRRGNSQQCRELIQWEWGENWKLMIALNCLANESSWYGKFYNLFRVKFFSDVSDSNTLNTTSLLFYAFLSSSYIIPLTLIVVQMNFLLVSLSILL